MSARSYYTVLDKTGKILYKSKSYEYIIPLTETLLFIQRGNFLGIMDLDGNWLFKTINGEME